MLRTQKQEFLMLAQNFSFEKQRANSWYASEKLDGIRCMWDGGVSRGMLASKVPWCNTAKHGRFVYETYATGLWSRYQQPIQAPDWFLNQLPTTPLDGELWTGYNEWQRLSSIIKQREPDARWRYVQYRIFDAPPLKTLFGDRTINNSNVKLKIQGALDWVLEHKGKNGWYGCMEPQTFYKTHAQLKDILANRDVVQLHEQRILDSRVKESIQQIQDWNAEVLAKGGEGLILRSPASAWVTHRSWDLLKVKTTHDMEGIVIGYTFALGTDLAKSISGTATDKILGKMGSVQLRLPNGKELSLSGFTHEERQLNVITEQGVNIPGEPADAYGILHPGEKVPDWIGSRMFPRGSKITFKYREMSNDNIPKEARYLRKHEDL